MNLHNSKKFLCGLTAMLMAVSSTLPSFTSLRAQAKGETELPLIYTADGETSANPVTLLIGTNNQQVAGKNLRETMTKVNQYYALGIASQFCTFLEGDMRVYDSDAEGRVAIGGNFYNYTGSFTPIDDTQDNRDTYGLSDAYFDSLDEDGFPMGNFSEKTVGTDVVGGGNWSYNMGKGDYGSGTPLEMLEIEDGKTNSGYASVIINGEDAYQKLYLKDGAGNTIEEKRMISLDETYAGGNPRYMVSDNPNSNALDCYNARSVYTDRILDVAEQFDLLRTRSRLIAEQSTPGAVIEAVGGDPHTLKCSYTGDEDLSTIYFNFGSEYSLENLESIEFDVPEDAYVVINVLDDNVVIRNDGVPITTIYNGTTINNPIPPLESWENGDAIGQENDTAGCMKNNLPGTEKILYNMPNAEKLSLNANFNGTLFAPNADISAFLLDPTETNPEKPEIKYPNNGHISGAIIAKSFTGTLEIGYRPFSGPYSMLGTSKYKISLKKLEETNFGGMFPNTTTPLKGAVLTLFSVGADGKPDTADDIAVGSVTSSGDTAADIISFEPDPLNEDGKYYLKETAAPAGYSFDPTVYYFTITEEGSSELSPVQVGETPNPIRVKYVVDEAKAGTQEADGTVQYISAADRDTLASELVAIGVKHLSFDKFEWNSSIDANSDDTRWEIVTSATFKYLDGTEKKFTFGDVNGSPSSYASADQYGSDISPEDRSDISQIIFEVERFPAKIELFSTDCFYMGSVDNYVKPADTESTIPLTMHSRGMDGNGITMMDFTLELDPITAEILTLDSIVADDPDSIDASFDSSTGEVSLKGADGSKFFIKSSSSPFHLNATLASLETIKDVASANGMELLTDKKNGIKYYKFPLTVTDFSSQNDWWKNDSSALGNPGYLIVAVETNVAGHQDTLKLHMKNESGDDVIWWQTPAESSQKTGVIPTDSIIPTNFYRLDDSDPTGYKTVPGEPVKIYDYVQKSSAINFTNYGKAPYNSTAAPVSYPISFDGTTGSTFKIKGFTDPDCLNFAEEEYTISDIVPDATYSDYSETATITLSSGETFTNKTTNGTVPFKFYRTEDDEWIATYLGDTLYPDLTLVDDANAYEFKDHKGAITFKKFNERGAALKGADIEMTKGSVAVDLVANGETGAIGWGTTYTVDPTTFAYSYNDLNDEETADAWSWSQLGAATAIPFDKLDNAGSASAKPGTGTIGYNTPATILLDGAPVSYYRISETSAPEGYEVADDIIFFVVNTTNMMPFGASSYKVYSTTVKPGEMPDSFPFEYTYNGGFGGFYTFNAVETEDEDILAKWTIQDSATDDALLSMTDTRLPGVKLYLWKYDSVTGKPIKDGDVQLELWSEDGDATEPLGTWNTKKADADGYVHISDDEEFVTKNGGKYLKPGCYSIVETTAPKGYQLPSAEKAKTFFTVNPNLSIALGKEFITELHLDDATHTKPILADETQSFLNVSKVTMYVTGVPSV